MEAREIGVTPIYNRTRECKAKTIINVGGAGSSKSYSIAQLLIEKLCQEKGKKIGICRKTFPALRMTALDLVIGLLKDYGIYNPKNHNKSNSTYNHNSNVIQFFSLDDPVKIRSTDFNYLWLEEAGEFTWEDYITLKLRLRAPTLEGEPNQMFLSLNPTDAHSWIATKLCGV